MTFADRFKELRIAKDLTQRELSRAINISQSTIAMYENGKREPSRETLNIIADFFNVPVDLLLGRIDGLEGKGPMHPILESKPHTLTEAESKQEALNQVIARDKVTPIKPVLHHSYRIPILGRVAAGTPIYASEDVIGYQYIDESYQDDGYEYFALLIKGQSMEPSIMDGDTVIVRKQDYIEDGQIAIVLIDGEDATAKEVKETPEGIVLIGHNAAVYAPHFYSRQEIEELPVQIIGRVIQSIRKF